MSSFNMSAITSAMQQGVISHQDKLTDLMSTDLSDPQNMIQLNMETTLFTTQLQEEGAMVKKLNDALNQLIQKNG